MTGCRCGTVGAGAHAACGKSCSGHVVPTELVKLLWLQILVKLMQLFHTGPAAAADMLQGLGEMTSDESSADMRLCIFPRFSRMRT